MFGLSLDTTAVALPAAFPRPLIVLSSRNVCHCVELAAESNSVDDANPAWPRIFHVTTAPEALVHEVMPDL